MTDLPRGTVTFLFTDVEGSTGLLKALGRERYAEALREHERILREAFAREGGEEIDTQGDAFFVAFEGASDAIKAAESAQRALADHAWPGESKVRVRMGIHTGEPARGGERYVGLGVHKAARICAAGHGGQVLLSRLTHDLIDDEELPGIAFEDLGEQRLKDLDRSERIYQLVMTGLPASFPPLKTVKEPPFSGRESELAAAAEARVEASRRRRRRELLGAALIGVVAAAVAIPVFALGGGEPRGETGSSAHVVPNSIVVINPETGQVTADVPVGQTPGHVVFGQGAVWVGNFEDKTVSRIDPKSSADETIGLGIRPYGLAFGAGALWVGDRGHNNGTGVSRVDLITHRIERIRIGPGSDFSADVDIRGAPSLAGRSVAMAVEGGSVWVGNRYWAQLVKVDSFGRRVVKKLTGFDPASIAYGNRSIWVVDTTAGTLLRVDPRSNRVVATIQVGQAPCCVVATPGAVWVVTARREVWRISPSSNTVEGTVDVGEIPVAIAAGSDGVWVANYGDSSVSRIDLRSHQVRTTELPRRPVGIAIGGGSVWVTVD
jgi:YVTN family beta-propeller protein